MNTCLMLRNRWGWGWGGVITFIAHEHMFDATLQYATVGVGVGWGVIIFIVHEHMFDACYATVEVGVWWGVITFIVHEHMFDATQQLGLGCGGV